MSEESNSNNQDLDDAIKSETMSENSVYANILAKLRSVKEKSENKEYHRDVLSDGAKYMTDLIEIIEEHKENPMDQNTALSIEGAFQLFINGFVQINMKELFDNDSNSAKEMFYLYMNLFNLSAMKHYFQRVDMQTFVQVLYGEFISIFLLIISLTVAQCKFTIVDVQEPRDNRQIFLLMLNFLKGELDPDSSITYSATTNLILSFLWNYADKTVVVPNLIKVGYPEAILKWLSLINRSDGMSLTFNLSNLLQSTQKSKSEAIRPSISIIHNISRHDDGINILNELDAINIIKKVQSSTENSEINILCCMTLALLSTSEQIKNDRKHMNNALDQLLQNVSNASQSNEYKDDGFHISEPLVVLVKLFNDDRALNYILQHAQVELNASSTVEFFIQLLLNFHQTVNRENDPLKELTCIALVNILWSISFQENYHYKRQLKTNSNLTKLLELFSNIDQTNETETNSSQYVPKYLESIQTAAKGILFNINENTSNNTGLLTISRRRSVVDTLISLPPSIVKNNDDKPTIMISYSHDDKELCYQLEDELKRNNQFQIWIDKEFCTTGDSWEQIARGIKQSQVVLCLITKNYTSKSVRREVIYAIDKLDKPLLPVFILKPDVPEWLDIRTCDLTHVRFNDEKQLERSKISKLMETLNKLITGSTRGGTSPPTHYESTAPIMQTLNEETIEDRDEHPKDTYTSLTKTNLSRKSIDQWNKTDIKQWFEENGILIELYQMFQFTDGSELLSYAQILSQDEKEHYKIYAEEFRKLYNGKILLLHQFNKFSNALHKLSHQQTPRRKSIPSSAKSSTCILL